jgi:DNA end-binding protein Ku
MAPRSIWNGTIAFGLVNVPVKVHSATESKTVRFHQVHASDGARIEQRRICSKEGREVPYEEVVKGYEVAEDEYVVLTKEEIEAAAGARSRVIEIEDFVCAPEIDPVFYDKTYFLGAREDGCDAYRLLHDALAATRRVGIGRWVFHNREYLAAVRSLDGVLALHTMRFHDEVVDADELEIPAPRRKPSDREVKMACALVDSLHDEFRPKAFHDTYREAVLELVRRKAEGEEIEPPPAEEPESAPDLMAALEASVKASRKKR